MLTLVIISSIVIAIVFSLIRNSWMMIDINKLKSAWKNHEATYVKCEYCREPIKKTKAIKPNWKVEQYFCTYSHVEIHKKDNGSIRMIYYNCEECDKSISSFDAYRYAKLLFCGIPCYELWEKKADAKVIERLRK